MGKITWKPGTMLYPLPAVMVTSALDGKDNIITVAWTGIICSEPAMTYISIRPSRYSYDIIKESKEFVINLTTAQLAYATDKAGVKSGRDCDKFELLNLNREKASVVSCPLIKESPVNIECIVKEINQLGSHDMFIAEIVAVNVDEKYIDEKGRFDMEKAGVMAYSHGNYYALGGHIGKFGYSVEKKKS